MTSEGNELITIPKSLATRPSSRTTGAATTSSVPSSTVKVVVGKKMNPKVRWGDQVTGANKYGPAENTQSQTKDHTTMAAKATAPGYQKLVVDEVDIESDTETLEEVHPILDDESCQQDDPEDSECPSGGEGEQ